MTRDELERWLRSKARSAQPKPKSRTAPKVLDYRHGNRFVTVKSLMYVYDLTDDEYSDIFRKCETRTDGTTAEVLLPVYELYRLNTRIKKAV